MYTEELENLITEILMPVYIEHLTRTGQLYKLKEINARLLSAIKQRRKVPALLWKTNTLAESLA